MARNLKELITATWLVALALVFVVLAVDAALRGRYPAAVAAGVISALLAIWSDRHLRQYEKSRNG